VVEQLDEHLSAGLGGDEAERCPAPHVDGSHEGQGPMADVLELAPYGLARHHRHVRVAAFERLDARLLVHADDVLVVRRLVVKARIPSLFARNSSSLRMQPVALRERVHEGHGHRVAPATAPLLLRFAEGRVPDRVGSHDEALEVASELSRQLIALFALGPDGRRPGHGPRELLRSDPHFKDHLSFYEYFNGDTGEGLGARTQTGWTALVAKLLEQSRLWR
jgi:hypothetical protein